MITCRNEQEWWGYQSQLCQKIILSELLMDISLGFTRVWNTFSYNTVSFQGVRLVVKITAQKMMITGSKWILNICYGNRIPHDVKQLYFICNYYRLVRNEIVHCGTGRVELRQAKTELNNLTDDLAISNIRGHLNTPNNFTNLILMIKCYFQEQQERFVTGIQG